MERKTTIKDVAASAGVSISAVSYILNGAKDKKYTPETVRRVQKAAQELRYVPTNIARGMRSQRSYAIGVVSFWDFDNRVFVKTLEGIVTAGRREGYSVILCPVSLCPLGEVIPDDFSYTDYFTGKRVDGFILMAPATIERHLHEEAHIKHMQQQNIPHVIINGESDLPESSYICYDYRSTTRTAAEYLHENGHRDCTYVTPKAGRDSREYRLRLEGFWEAEPMGRVVWLENVTPEMLRRCESIVTNKSGTARQLVHMAADHGISVPEELSVVSGNVENYSAFLHPPLTCIQLPFVEMGELAAAWLIQQINGDSQRKKQSFGGTILAGGTVKTK